MATKSIQALKIVFVLVAISVLIWGAFQLYDAYIRGDIRASTYFIPMVALAVLCILWVIPNLQVAYRIDVPPEKRFELEDKARGTLTQLVGGLAVIGVIVAAINNVELARQSEFTDRLLRTLPLLGIEPDKSGRKQTDVRTAAVYALERISKQAPLERELAHNILSHYIQNNAPVRGQKLVGSQKGHAASVPEHERPEPDIEAALRVLLRRTISDSDGQHWLELSETDLHGADFTNGADIAQVPYPVAKMGRMRLAGANLRGAFLWAMDLSLAVFWGADLSDAHLEGSNLAGCDLTNAVLRGTYLQRTDLSAVKGLTQKQLDMARGDSATSIPAGLLKPQGWLQH